MTDMNEVLWAAFEDEIQKLAADPASQGYYGGAPKHKAMGGKLDKATSGMSYGSKDAAQQYAAKARVAPAFKARAGKTLKPAKLPAPRYAPAKPADVKRFESKGKAPGFGGFAGTKRQFRAHDNFFGK